MASHPRVAGIVFVACLFSGCGGCYHPVEECPSKNCDGGAGDGGLDAGTDAGGGGDAGVDGGQDAGFDAGADAGNGDAGLDAGADAGGDGGSTCDAGFADCDGQPANGCETSILNNPAHCGTCTTVCPSTLSCGSGACCVPVPSGLVGRWDAEDGGADTAGANPGQLFYGVGFVPGKRGQAFSFDGVSFLQATTSNLPVGSANRTMELWARLDAQPAFQAIFAGYGEFGTGGSAYELGTAINTVFFSDWGMTLPGPNLAVSTWHHVAVTNVGTTVTLYVDGSLVATNSQSLNTVANSTLYMGRVLGTGYDIKLIGLVDEVAIYNRALSASEVQSIYASSSYGKCR